MEILKEQGNTEQAARSFIGKLIKKHGKYKTAHAIADTCIQEPMEAKAYLIRILTPVNESPGVDRQRIEPAQEKRIEVNAKEALSKLHKYREEQGV